MDTLIQVLAVVSILTNAVIYGTDVFAAVVQRAALASVDDATLTSMMGQGHRYGNARLPFAGVTGLVTALLAAVVAAIDGRTTTAVSAAIAVVALVCWLTVFGRVSAPINRQLIDAAVAGRTPPDVRSLQHTWDSVINLRVGLQTIAVIGLCLTLISVSS